MATLQVSEEMSVARSIKPHVAMAAVMSKILAGSTTTSGRKRLERGHGGGGETGTRTKKRKVKVMT